MRGVLPDKVRSRAVGTIRQSAYRNRSGVPIESIFQLDVPNGMDSSSSTNRHLSARLVFLPLVRTDRNDAEAICEAMSRPAMRFVALKSVEQQDIQAIHRVRSELVRQRTGKANQIRGLVGEYGLVAPVRIAQLRAILPDWLEDADNGLAMRFRR